MLASENGHNTPEQKQEADCGNDLKHIEAYKRSSWSFELMYAFHYWKSLATD